LYADLSGWYLIVCGVSPDESWHCLSLDVSRQCLPLVVSRQSLLLDVYGRCLSPDVSGQVFVSGWCLSPDMSWWCLFLGLSMFVSRRVCMLFMSGQFLSLEGWATDVSGRCFSPDLSWRCLFLDVSMFSSGHVQALLMSRQCFFSRWLGSRCVCMLFMFSQCLSLEGRAPDASGLCFSQDLSWWCLFLDVSMFFSGRVQALFMFGKCFFSRWLGSRCVWVLFVSKCVWALFLSVLVQAVFVCLQTCPCCVCLQTCLHCVCLSLDLSWW